MKEAERSCWGLEPLKHAASCAIQIDILPHMGMSEDSEGFRGKQSTLGTSIVTRLLGTTSLCLLYGIMVPTLWGPHCFTACPEYRPRGPDQSHWKAETPCRTWRKGAGQVFRVAILLPGVFHFYHCANMTPIHKMRLWSTCSWLSCMLLARCAVAICGAYKSQPDRKKWPDAQISSLMCKSQATIFVYFSLFLFRKHWNSKTNSLSS